ncbi:MULTISPECIES: hypothetical protein [unclassified Stygiolobus]
MFIDAVIALTKGRPFQGIALLVLEIKGLMGFTRTDNIEKFYRSTSVR